MLPGSTGGDWYCPKCNNMNYARRTQCNRQGCDFEKKDLDDYGSRMGMGPMGGSMPASMGMGGGMGPMGMGPMGPGPMGGGGMMGGMQGGPMGGMGGKRQPEPRPGDWDCPRCYNLNFSSRNRCNGTKNGEPCGLKKPDFVGYGVPLIKNKALYKEGDWDCWRCSNVNFKIREACHKCHLPKAEAQSDQFRSEAEEGDGSK